MTILVELVAALYLLIRGVMGSHEVLHSRRLDCCCRPVHPITMPQWQGLLQAVLLRTSYWGPHHQGTYNTIDIGAEQT